MNKIIIGLIILIGGWQYVSKRVKLEDTLAWSKKNPGNQYADDVNYYVGLVYYQRSDYPRAQQAFQQLLQDHATSPHIAPALVKLEDSAEGNHDWEVARLAVDTYLNRYEEDFPKDKSKEIMEKRAEHLKMRGK